MARDMVYCIDIRDWFEEIKPSLTSESIWNAGRVFGSENLTKLR